MHIIIHRRYCFVVDRTVPFYAFSDNSAFASIQSHFTCSQITGHIVCPGENTSTEFTIDQNVQIEITIVEPVAESQSIRMNTFAQFLYLSPLWKPCRIINDIVVLVSLIRVSFYYTVRFTDLLIDECRTSLVSGCTCPGSGHDEAVHIIRNLLYFTLIV